MADNPRFPHNIKIYRAAKDDFGNILFDDNGEPAYTLIHDSICGIRTQSGNIRTSGEVINADYKLALPRHFVDIQAGDLCILTTYTSTKKLTVLKSETYNMGSNIWANNNSN